MKNICLLFLPLLLLTKIGHSQGLFKKSVKSAYVLYGRHFITKYSVDSGSTNLAGSKMYIGWQAGFNLDYNFNKNWGLRTGIAAHIHFVAEIFYGVTAVPDSISKLDELQPKNKIPAQALLDPLFIERKSIGIPVKAMYQMNLSKKYDLKFTGGLYLNIYFPSRNENISQLIPLPDSLAPYGYNYTAAFTIHRDFNKSADLSKPFIEWQSDIEVIRKFKRSGAILAGMKIHIGTKKLEKAEFTTWPDFSDSRSKGHYTLNRSYIGVYAGYRFGKNHSK